LQKSRVLSAQEVEVAERDKKLQLINAEKEGESEAIQITTLARAEKEAAQEHVSKLKNILHWQTSYVMRLMLLVS